MTAPQVHDLIRVDPGIATRWDAPPWVAAALARAPWVVVRRACRTAAIPIGVRGAVRMQRFAARIDMADERERLTPAQLVARAGAGADRLARATHAVDAAASGLGMPWGIAGAYGFELASGLCTTHAGSDLDIVLWGPLALATLCAFAAQCAQIQRATGVRIDADVCFADAGFALAELVSRASVILAKTSAGPRLFTRPAEH